MYPDRVSAGESSFRTAILASAQIGCWPTISFPSNHSASIIVTDALTPIVRRFLQRGRLRRLPPASNPNLHVNLAQRPSSRSCECAARLLYAQSHRRIYRCVFDSVVMKRCSIDACILFVESDKPCSPCSGKAPRSKIALFASFLTSAFPSAHVFCASSRRDSPPRSAKSCWSAKCLSHPSVFHASEAVGCRARNYTQICSIPHNSSAAQTSSSTKGIPFFARAPAIDGRGRRLETPLIKIAAMNFRIIAPHLNQRSRSLIIHWVLFVAPTHLGEIWRRELRLCRQSKPAPRLDDLHTTRMN